MDVHKKLIAKIAAVFVAVLLFLTFFSSTIYNFNLPSVTVDFTKEGVLTKSAEGMATVEYVEKDMYYAEASGRITLLVLEGEMVSEESELYTIDADVESLQHVIDELLLNEERIQLRIDRARADSSRAQESLGNFIEESTEFDPSEFDFELQRLQTEVEAAQRDLDDYTVLYEAGIVSLRELEDIQAVLDGHDFMLQLQNDRMKRAQEDHARLLRDRTRDLERAAADIRGQIREHEFELSANQREIDRIRAQIENSGVVTVLSERSGLVRDVHADTGMHVNKNELLMTVGAANGGFKAVLDLPENVDYLSVGDMIPFEIRSKDILNRSGEIRSLLLDGGRLKAEIQFRIQGLRGGETLEFKVTDTSRLHGMLIPNSALRTNGPGEYFVLYAEMEEDSGSDEFFARRMPVEVIASDNQSTAIRMRTDERLSIIINSDRVVSEGDKIRIVGGNDIDETR